MLVLASGLSSRLCSTASSPLQAMSNLDGHEDETNYLLHRIETMIAARTEAGNTKEDLEEREAALEERETMIQDRETTLADRERLVAAREEAVARRESLSQINPPPPPVNTERAKCQHCGHGVCSRSSPCFDSFGRDMHTHGCAACHDEWKKYGQKGRGRGKGHGQSRRHY